MVHKVAHARKRNPLSDLNKILHGGRYPRRNHLCQFWWRSVEGLKGGGGSKFALLHWLWSSPLQHSRTTVWVCDKMGWWRWALLNVDGMAPIQMVSVSASVNLPLHHKVQKFSSGISSPGWSRKKGRKTVVVVVIFIIAALLFCHPLSLMWSVCKHQQQWQGGRA